MQSFYISYITLSNFFYNFKFFFLFFIIGVILSILLLLLNFFLYKNRFYKEKLSPYECGFEPFDSARISFNIHYYLIGILFIIFDAEVVFLFP